MSIIENVLRRRTPEAKDERSLIDLLQDVTVVKLMASDLVSVSL